MNFGRGVDFGSGKECSRNLLCNTTVLATETTPPVDFDVVSEITEEDTGLALVESEENNTKTCHIMIC